MTLPCKPDDRNLTLAPCKYPWISLAQPKLIESVLLCDHLIDRLRRSVSVDCSSWTRPKAIDRNAEWHCPPPLVHSYSPWSADNSLSDTILYIQYIKKNLPLLILMVYCNISYIAPVVIVIVYMK